MTPFFAILTLDRISWLGLKRSPGPSSLPNFSARVKKVPRTFTRFRIFRLGLKRSPGPSSLPNFSARVKNVHWTFLILYKVTQWFASAWVAEFAKGFGFDLTDPFTGHVEDFPPHLPKSAFFHHRDQNEDAKHFLHGLSGYQELHPIVHVEPHV